MLPQDRDLGILLWVLGATLGWWTCHFRPADQEQGVRNK